MLWLLLSMLYSQKGGVPDLAGIFIENRRADFSAMLPDDGRIFFNLTPLLHDHGNLSRQQVLMGLDKLLNRFQVTQAQVTNFQSDTNYAWLEVYLSLALVERATGLKYFTTFAFHYKIIGSRIAISRWVIQDVH